MIILFAQQDINSYRANFFYMLLFWHAYLSWRSSYREGKAVGNMFYVHFFALLYSVVFKNTMLDCSKEMHNRKE